MDTYSGYAGGPPCRSFSTARKDGDGGPPVLRDPSGPGRYGKEGLRGKHKDTVRLDTALAINNARMLARGVQLDSALFYETPLPVFGVCSMLDLDEYTALLPEFDWLEVDQCMWGGT